MNNDFLLFQKKSLNFQKTIKVPNVRTDCIVFGGSEGSMGDCLSFLGGFEVIVFIDGWGKRYACQEN